jgi:glutathione S-transferase
MDLPAEGRLDLFLYHGQTSTCSSKVRIVLAEKGISWTGKVLDLHRGDQFDPAYLRLNPNAVVPTLMVDGAPVIESGLILQLADEIGPGPALTPTDPVARARMRLWLKRIDDDLHPAVSVLTYALQMRRGWLQKSLAEMIAAVDRLPSPAARDRRRQVLLDGMASQPARAALRAARRYFTDLEATIGADRSSVGGDVTLADLAPLSYLHRAELLGLSWLWQDLPKLGAWYARITARPSVKAGLLDWMREADLARYEGLDVEGAAARSLLD